MRPRCCETPHDTTMNQSSYIEVTPLLFQAFQISKVLGVSELSSVETHETCGETLLLMGKSSQTRKCSQQKNVPEQTIWSIYLLCLIYCDKVKLPNPSDCRILLDHMAMFGKDCVSDVDMVRKLRLSYSKNHKSKTFPSMLGPAIVSGVAGFKRNNFPCVWGCSANCK